MKKKIFFLFFIRYPDGNNMFSRAVVAAILVLGATAGKDEGCSSFRMHGFADPQLDGKWWAQHPTLTLNGIPTYWTGAAQNTPGWESTGLLFMYWCNIGSGGWYIEGNDISKRDKIFKNGDCIGLARRSDANKVIKSGEGNWLEGDLSNPKSATVTTSTCTGIQLNSCASQCKGLPVGVPFDTCVPLTMCGSRSGMNSYVRIVTTKQDQKTWDTVTYQVFSDQACTRSLAGKGDEPPVTLRCDQCDPLLGNAMVPCTAMQDLKPDPASSNGVFMGIALTLVLLAIVLAVFYCALRRNHDQLKQTRNNWQNAREMREPLINDTNDDSPPEEVDALAEKVARYYEDSGKTPQHPCGEVARLALQQSDNPNQLLFNKLKDQYPEDRGLLADIFLGGLSSSPAAARQSTPPATPPEQRDVEEALVAAEANRKAREAEEYERQHSIPPVPVEGKTADEQQPEENWNDAPSKEPPVEEDWEDAPSKAPVNKAAEEENWDEPTKKEPAPVEEENWDEPTKKEPAPAPAAEENWDEPAKKSPAPVEEENWDEPTKKAPAPAPAPAAEENWDEPAKKSPAPVEEENWDEPTKKAPAPAAEENWEEDAPAPVPVSKKEAAADNENWDEPAPAPAQTKTKASSDSGESWEDGLQVAAIAASAASAISLPSKKKDKKSKADKKAKSAPEESWDDAAAVAAVAATATAKAAGDDDAWEDEKPAPKKVPAKTAADEAWEDEKPAPKKASAKEESWDEEPVAKAKQPEESWDDAAPAPKATKAKAAAATDEAWEDETPALKTKGKPKQNPQKDDEWEDEKVVLRKVNKPDTKDAADDEWDETPALAKASQAKKDAEAWDDEPAPAKGKEVKKSTPEESWDETPAPSKEKPAQKHDEEDDWGAVPVPAMGKKGPGHLKQGQLDKWEDEDPGENFKNVKLRKTDKKPENWEEGADQDAWDDAPAPAKKKTEESWDEEPAKKPKKKAADKNDKWEEEDNWESTPSKKTVPKKVSEPGGKQDDWDESGDELAKKLAARRAAPADDGWIEEVEWDDAIDAADEDADWGDAPVAIVPSSPVEKEKHGHRQPTGLEVRIIEASNIPGASHNIQVLLASKGQRVRKTAVRDTDGNVVKWDQKFKMKLPEKSLPMNLQFRVCC